MIKLLPYWCIAIYSIDKSWWRQLAYGTFFRYISLVRLHTFHHSSVWINGKNAVLHKCLQCIWSIHSVVMVDLLVLSNWENGKKANKIERNKWWWSRRNVYFFSNKKIILSHIHSLWTVEQDMSHRCDFAEFLQLLIDWRLENMFHFR